MTLFKNNMFTLQFRSVLNCNIYKNYSQLCQYIINNKNTKGFTFNNKVTAVSPQFIKIMPQNIVCRHINKNNISRNQKSSNTDFSRHQRHPVNSYHIDDDVNVTDERHNDSLNFIESMNNYIQNDNLEAASRILNLAISSKDISITRLFELLIRAYAIQKDPDNCFKLFLKMEKLGLETTDRVCTSLLSSIANCRNSDKAMNLLNCLKNVISEKNQNFNSIHYSIIFRIYKHHSKVNEAFELFDKMNCKQLRLLMLKELLGCASSDTKNGLKLSLLVWHIMKFCKIQPDLLAYNLLLANISLTKFGDLRVNETLSRGKYNFEIRVVNDDFSNLLENPLRISKSTLIQVSSKIHGRKKQSLSEHSYIDMELSNTNIKLDDIHQQDKLLLFGGYENILHMMKKDGVQPNVMTLTNLLKMAPHNIFAENEIINKAEKLQIPLDIKFFNCLMRKRCIRHDYEDAKDVLQQIKDYKLSPNIETWNILAMTCHGSMNIEKHIYNMQQEGYSLNNKTIEIFIKNLCYSSSSAKYSLMIRLLEYMKDNKIMPSDSLIKKLDESIRYIEKNILQGEKEKKSRQNDCLEYVKLYKNWKTKIQLEKLLGKS